MIRSDKKPRKQLHVIRLETGLPTKPAEDQQCMDALYPLTFDEAGAYEAFNIWNVPSGQRVGKFGAQWTQAPTGRPLIQFAGDGSIVCILDEESLRTYSTSDGTQLCKDSDPTAVGLPRQLVPLFLWADTDTIINSGLFQDHPKQKNAVRGPWLRRLAVEAKGSID